MFLLRAQYVNPSIWCSIVSCHTLQPERVLEASASYARSPEGNIDDIALLTEEIRNTFLVKSEELASQGLRVIGLASRTIFKSQLEGISREDAEKDFVFRGLAGIFDPPRPETLEAVRSCKQAGIVVHMSVVLHLGFSEIII